VDLTARGDVGLERKRFAAAVRDLFGGPLRAVAVDVRAHHIGALARKDHGRGVTDAARGAGDDDGLADEIVRGLGHGVALWCSGQSWLGYETLIPPLVPARGAHENRRG